TIKVAKDFPTTYFEQATGYKLAPNVTEYNARFYEGRFLCGLIAGKMTKSHTIGYVAAFPIPEVLQGINAFTVGLRSVDPKATVKVIWVNSWYDPGREREAAETLISQGADILLNHTDSTAVVQTAEEKGVWVLAYNSDMHKWGPKAQLSSVTLEWGAYYTKVAKDVLAGTWKSTSIWGGIGQGFIKLAPFSSAIPPDVVALVGKKQAEVASGKLSPFTGPLSDNTGKQVAAPGVTISDADLQTMGYYVAGVEGKVPGGT
ncbi:MAG TPA: BMP family ABC transporter substrate-binding protein, partial [Candidatus Baltobacteraceae bacterium]